MIGRGLWRSKNSQADRDRTSGSRSSKAKKPIDKHQSSRVLNKILETLGFEDYLEVGVQAGVTFKDVSAPRRDAVDPKFLLETDTLASSTTRFFEMPSDEFFASACDKTYDLIFLDGLHTFEQCYRDLCAGLQVLREPGAILIDDTLPGDFFSSLPTLDMAIAAREEHGLSARAWTGDVFKVVLMLHEFYPNLNYVTLRDPANPAHKPNTLVWREKRPNFGPAHFGVAKIQSAGYFDLPNLEPYFRFTQLDDGLDKLFAAKSKS